VKFFLVLAFACIAHASIVVTGNFGPNGDIGFVTSPAGLSISFGDGNGSLYQMDGFVNGQQLGNGAPAGLIYTFSAAQPTADQLLLSYSFVNNSGSSMPGFQFLFFADPDIGPDFADEWANAAGTPGHGLTGYQIGDPQLSSIFTNLLNGTLSNVNEQNSANPGDVSIALGFDFGTLSAGQTASFQVLLSDDDSQLGSFSITQSDPAFARDRLTVSGIAPEPSSLALFGTGAVLYALRRLRSSPK
jgi:hypothetical protein